MNIIQWFKTLFKVVADAQDSLETFNCTGFKPIKAMLVEDNGDPIKLIYLKEIVYSFQLPKIIAMNFSDELPIEPKLDEFFLTFHSNDLALYKKHPKTGDMA